MIVLSEDLPDASLDASSTLVWQGLAYLIGAVSFLEEDFNELPSIIGAPCARKLILQLPLLLDNAGLAVRRIHANRFQFTFNCKNRDFSQLG